MIFWLLRGVSPECRATIKAWALLSMFPAPNKNRKKSQLMSYSAIIMFQCGGLSRNKWTTHIACPFGHVVASKMFSVSQLLPNRDYLLTFSFPMVSCPTGWEHIFICGPLGFLGIYDPHLQKIAQWMMFMFMSSMSEPVAATSHFNYFTFHVLKIVQTVIKKFGKYFILIWFFITMALLGKYFSCFHLKMRKWRLREAKYLSHS